MHSFIPINDEEIVVKRVWTKPILRTILEIGDPGWDAYMAEVAGYVVYQDFTSELPEICPDWVAYFAEFIATDPGIQHCIKHADDDSFYNPPPLEPDEGDITDFVETLFARADAGTFVSLRSFVQSDRGVPPPYVRAVKLNGTGHSALIDEAVTAARLAANAEDALVFAPPVATFRSSQRASEANLANGLTLSVELDTVNTTEARGRLEGLLGVATVVVRSGGEWTDPETGEMYSKLHLHWRLTEPTREAADHAKLKLARGLACDLVGGDASAKTPVHPLRWPGSWHLKGTPRLARIIAINTEAEINLGEAADVLEAAVEAAGLRHNGAGEANGTPEADPALVASALSTIPNEDLPWSEWVRIGMATWRATAGATAGLDAWRTWSQKSGKFEVGACEERWTHFATSPPTKIGFGTLAFLAKEAGWEWPEGPEAAPGGPVPGLAEFLSVQTWMKRPIPEPDRLLSDLLTTTTRMFLVGRTGLGKTQMGFGFGCAMASGTKFLHWQCTRPARVLLVDGEMPAELIKARSIAAVRRSEKAPENLVIYNRDLEDEMKTLFPTIGPIQPLNTAAGQRWLLALIDALGGVDAVILDNVMSLISGDQKDELAWAETMPLVHVLTGRRIAQLWLDHTGWNTDRQYGSSTKAWHFDAVGVTALPEDQRNPHEVAFSLSFSFPGKARRRTPDNWADFETCIVRLKDDAWSSEPASKPPGGGKFSKIPPSREIFYDALTAAITKSAVGPGQTTLPTWELECLRRGLIERAPDAEESWKARAARFARFRTARVALLGARWISIQDDLVFDLKGQWK